MSPLSILFAAAISSVTLLETCRAAMEAVPFRATEPIVNGELTDWNGNEYLPFNVDDLREQQLTGRIFWAWNRQNLFVALQFFKGDHQGSSARNASLIEVFIDVRPFWGTHYDRYSEGVFKIEVQRSRSGTAVVTSDYQGQRITCVVSVAERDEEGYTSVEMSIPWDVLGQSSVAEGDALALACRFTTETGNLAVWPSVAQASVAKLDRDPMLFWPLRLGRAVETPSGDLRIQAREVLVGSVPWLEVEALVPSGSGAPAPGQYSVYTGEGAFLGTLSLHTTVGGQWRRGVIWNKIDHRFRSRVVGILNEDGDSVGSVTFVAAVSDMLEEIDRVLPKDRIAALPEKEYRIANLYRSCAIESAALLSTAADDVRSGHIIGRAKFEPDGVAQRAREFVRLGKSLLDGHRLPNGFPILAWKSAIDGAWLPMSIAFPWNYRPGGSYPLTLVVNGRNSRRDRSHFVLPKVLAYEDGLFVNRSGSGYTIELFGRGNSAEMFSEEELDMVFEELVESLNVDRKRVIISGHSTGAAAALNVALRSPDLFAGLVLRAGLYKQVLDGDLDLDAADSVERLSTLQHAHVHLEAGDQDRPALQCVHKLLDLFAMAGVQTSSKIIKDTPHMYMAPAVPADVMEGAEEIAAARTWRGRNVASLRNRELVVLGKASDEGMAELRIRKEIPGTYVLEPLNVRDMAIRRPFSGNTRSVVVGEMVLDYAHGGETWLRVQLIDGEWRTAAWGDRFPGLPMLNVEFADLLIVYGTTVREMAPYLKQRALRVADLRSGSAPGCWSGRSFRVIADHEVSGDDIDGRNLWCIGSGEENSFVKSLESRVPVSRPANLRRAAGLSEEVRDILWSYIYPIDRRLVVIELGTSKIAYGARVISSPNSAAVAQAVIGGEYRVIVEKKPGEVMDFTR